MTQIRIQIQNGFWYVICVVIPNEARVMLFVTRYHTCLYNHVGMEYLSPYQNHPQAGAVSLVISWDHYNLTRVLWILMRKYTHLQCTISDIYMQYWNGRQRTWKQTTYWLHRVDPGRWAWSNCPCRLICLLFTLFLFLTACSFFCHSPNKSSFSIQQNTISDILVLYFNCVLIYVSSVLTTPGLNAMWQVTPWPAPLIHMVTQCYLSITWHSLCIVI